MSLCHDEIEAREFYERWLQEELWGLFDAWRLYIGECPTTGKAIYGETTYNKGHPSAPLINNDTYPGDITWIDKDYDPNLRPYYEDLIIYDEQDRQLNLSTRLKNKIEKGEITGYKDNEAFDPIEIIAFFEKSTPYEAYPILPGILNINASSYATLSPKGANKKPMGRPAGSGAIHGDEERLVFMKGLIDQDKSTSIRNAAKQTIDEFGTSGAGWEADIRRLSRKYRKRY